MSSQRLLSAEVLEKIAPALQSAIAKGNPPGVVALIWRNGEIAHVATLGKRDISRNLPMQGDTMFRIRSMTKPIMSGLILMLMEEGKLRLDDPIVKWAPEFAGMRVLKDASGPLDDTYSAPRDITIDDLLTHRSGLAYSFSTKGPIADAYQRAFGNLLLITLSPDEFLKTLAALPLLNAPGERWRYSLGTDVLGVIAERIEGKLLREILRTRLLEPLEMTDTDFFIPPAKQHRAASLYFFDGKAAPPVRVTISDDAIPKFCSGGGGLISTADDYLKFARMLLGGGQADGVRLMKQETVALMTRDHLTSEQQAIRAREEPHWEGQGFGLGVGVDIDAKKRAWLGPTTDGAYGWPGSFGTWFRVDPAENMIIIYLVQHSPLGPEQLVRVFTGLGTALESFRNITYAALGRQN
jgi:CubicO group peptidase (beta-lactamase class C family)